MVGVTGTVAGLKQIIVVRKDLGMRAGKMVAQGAHASLAATLAHLDDPRVQQWLHGAFAKVCVRVESEAELIAVYEAARAAGLVTALITDSGRTEFHGVPTKTCIAVGPDTDDNLRPITGALKLL
jgi:PTH2 family peptidyl-tRNA hydrolase